MLSKENFLRTLQGWVCIVGIMAIGNTVSCFYDHSFLSARLYTGSPEKANDLTARLFGIWTLLSAVLRITCAFAIDNSAIYNLTLISFVLAFLHFISEIFIFKSAELSIGVWTPLIISGISSVLMLIGWWCQQKQEYINYEDNMPKRVEDIKLRPKMKQKNL